MILYVIRHAIAAPIGPEGDDSQRPLTDEGRTRMYRIAAGLKEMGETLDLILTSPFLRATQTARIVAKELRLGKEKVVQTESLAPGGQVADLVKEINGRYAGLQGVAIVGHEPYLSALIALLISGDPGLSITMKKGGVCRLSTDALQAGRCATLDWLLTPGQLVEIGG